MKSNKLDKCKIVLSSIFIKAKVVREHNLATLALANKINILDFMSQEDYEEIIKEFPIEKLNAAKNQDREFILLAAGINSALDFIFVEDDEVVEEFKNVFK